MDDTATATADPYATLGLTPSATAAEIKTAYRQLILKHHPDKVTDPALKEAASSKFHSIQQAHQVLSDPAKRLEHDNRVKHAAAAAAVGRTTARPNPFTSASYYHPPTDYTSGNATSSYYTSSAGASPFAFASARTSPFSVFGEELPRSSNYREFTWVSGRPGKDSEGRKRSQFSFRMSFDTNSGPGRDGVPPRQQFTSKSAENTSRPRYVFEIDSDDEHGPGDGDENDESDSDASDDSEYVIENPLDIFDAFHKSQLDMLREFHSFALGGSGPAAVPTSPQSRSFRHSTYAPETYDLFDSLFGGYETEPALEDDIDNDHGFESIEGPSGRERSRRSRATRYGRDRRQSLDGTRNRLDREDSEHSPSLLQAFLSLPKLAWQNRKSARPNNPPAFKRTESMPSFDDPAVFRRRQYSTPPEPAYADVNDLAEKIMDDQPSSLRSSDRAKSYSGDGDCRER